MREIKFRAWDKQNKVWLSHRETIELVFEWNGSFEIDGFEIVQFTGLLDKSGKEIYEGDICSGHSDGNGIIKWSKFDGGYNYEFDDENVVGIWEVLNDIRIIGNIYENPELLNDETLAGGTKAGGII